MVNKSLLFTMSGALALSLLVISVTLVDLSGKDRDFDRHLFLGGIGCLVAGTLIVYIATSSYLAGVEKAVISSTSDDAQGETPRALIHEARTFTPIFAVMVYLVEAYGLYLIFHLQTWSLAVGAALLLIVTIIELRFVYATGAELKRVSNLLAGGGPSELRAAMKLNPMSGLVRVNVNRRQ